MPKTIITDRFACMIPCVVDLPQGYVPLYFDIPTKGQYYLFGCGHVVKAAGKMRRAYLVVKKMEAGK